MADSDLFEPAPGHHPTVDELREACEYSPTWTGVSAAALQDFASVYEVVHVPGGKQLFARGRRHDFNYGVVHGRLRVVRRNAAGRPTMLTDLGRGYDAGLELHLGDGVALYDLHTVRDSVLLRVSRADFERLAPRHADVLLNAARAIVAAQTKMIEGSEGQSCQVVNVAVVPASRHPRLPGVVSALAGAFPDSVPVAHLTAAGVEAALGGVALGDADQAALHRLTPWLEAQERTHRLVFYECDATPSAWNEIALRQADRILVLAPAGTTPDPQAIRELLPDRLLPERREDIAAQRIDLLLAHEPDTELPSGTREWLDLGGFTSHYHVRTGRGTDFERVGRRLTGRAVGVVLGGGGARGIAHVGVMHALTEAGVPIDVVGGTSMGAICAAGWAMGMAPPEMLTRLRDIFAPKRALVDLTLPLIAITAGAKLERVLRSLYHDLLIEDLWTPFFCNSTNITKSAMNVHQQGSLLSGVRASISLPAIFPPVRSGDDVLVDGGVLDNLPIDTMAQLCDGGPVIAIDVSDSRPSEIDPRYDYTASGWGLMFRKLNPFAKKLVIPNMLEVIARCTVVASGRELERTRDLAALFLSPPVEDFGTMAFDQYEAIYRAGYDYAKERLADWQL